DLPDLCAGPDAVLVPERPVAEVRSLGAGVTTLPSSSYGSLASVCLHCLRDWSTNCEHVSRTTYGPAVAELKALLPEGGEVLVPGAGLGRLALDLAAEGYRVEANDASRIFLTVADFLLNRAPAAGLQLFPLAHVFSENWGHAQQYLEISVPGPRPEALAAASLGAKAGGPAITLVPGDFVKTYEVGGPGHRKFNAIVTCFFMDTPADVEELFRVLDNLLEVGGVWVNIGPLNWRKEARLKLCWEEVVAIWERKGYEFTCQKRADCDYHLPRGEKMYTDFPARELANMLYAWGISKFQNPKMMNQFLDNAARRAFAFDAQGMANAVYSLGVIGFKHENFLNAVSEEMQGRLREFKTQELANTVYALGKLKFRSDDLLGAICDYVPDRLPEFNAQELSNTVLALSQVGFKHDGFLTAAAEHIPRRLKEFNTQNIANTIYAMGALGVTDATHAPFVVAVSGYVATRLPELHKEKLVNNVLDSLKVLQRRMARKPGSLQPGEEEKEGRTRRPPPTSSQHAARLLSRHRGDAKRAPWMSK
ncbi:unnamed protein product, partial [Polarella glacialis]